MEFSAAVSHKAAEKLTQSGNPFFGDDKWNALGKKSASAAAGVAGGTSGVAKAPIGSHFHNHPARSEACKLGL